MLHGGQRTCADGPAHPLLVSPGRPGLLGCLAPWLQSSQTQCGMLLPLSLCPTRWHMQPVETELHMNLLDPWVLAMLWNCTCNRRLLALRQEYLPGGVRRSEEQDKQAAAQARMRKSVRGFVAAATAPALKSATQPAAAGQGGGGLQDAAAGGDTGSSSSEASTVRRRSTADAELHLPNQGIAWWEATGLDPTALLLKYRDLNIPNITLLLSTCCPTPPTGQARSRRSTKELDSGGLAGVQGGPKPQGWNSQSLSANKRNSSSRPQSAVPPRTSSSGSRPASAVEGSAAGGSRRGSRVLPRSPLHPGSGSGGTAAANGALSSTAGTAGGAGTAGSAPAVMGVTDEELLARLLAAASPQQAAAAFAMMGSRHAASVLRLLAGMHQGSAAVAALLQCLSPVVAAR